MTPERLTAITAKNDSHIFYNKLRAALFMLALSAVILFSALAHADETFSPAQAPAQLVENLSKIALTSLTDKTVSRDVREERVREVLHHYFDIETIGRFAMGTHWKTTSESQRKEYLDLFESMIVDTYTVRFEDYAGQTLKVGNATPANTKDHIVSSQIVQKDGPPVNLEWRVRNKDGAFKIVDIVVEGISMSVTQRSDFSAVIQRSGGNVETLLASLRERHHKSTSKSAETALLVMP